MHKQKIKYPFVYKYLNEKLDNERKDLLIYEKAANSDDCEYHQWGNGNVSSCKKRIEELEIVIETLKMSTNEND